MKTDPATGTRVRFGNFEADLRSGELRRDGLKVKIQELPFQVLVSLLERPGEVVSREELRKRLWPADTFVDFEHGLSKAVNKLREALRDDANNPRFVETLTRRGYRFIAPVEHIDSNSSAAGNGELAGASVGRASSRRWAMIAACALAGSLAGALIGGLAVWKFHAPPPQSSMHFSAVTNLAGVQSEPSLSPDGRSVAFVSNRDGPYEIYVGLISGGNLIKLTDDPNFKTRPCWSPDGARIAYARLNPSGIWDIWDVPALGGTPQRLILNAIDPAWSPDGQRMAYEKSTTGELWISGLSGQNAHLVAPVRYPLAHLRFRNAEPRFSDDGHKLAFVERGRGPYGELEVVNLDSGQLQQLTHDDVLALSPSWSPDGRSIYFASSRSGTMNLWKIAAAGGEPQQITAGQGDDAQLDVSPDGKRIVFSTFRERTSIAQLDLNTHHKSQELKPLSTDPGRSQLAPVYSPNGKHLAYFSALKGAEPEGIWLANADGSDPVPLIQDRTGGVFPHWSPDGNWLVYMTIFPGSDYRRISVSGGIPQALVKHGDQSDLFFDVGPHGRLLYQDLKGEVVAFNPQSNKTLMLGKVPESEKCTELRWSPDGRSIAYIRSPIKEDDPNEGLWVSDFKSAPRQIFRGWVVWYARASKSEIYFLEGKPDLNGVLWQVGWNGNSLSRLSEPIALTRSYWEQPGQNSINFFDVSPDGRHLALTTQSVIQANIGMIENVR